MKTETYEVGLFTKNLDRERGGGFSINLIGQSEPKKKLIGEIISDNITISP